MNSYRLTSMEEPGDERMAQIMREATSQAAQEKWGGAINRIKNGSY